LILRDLLDQLWINVNALLKFQKQIANSVLQMAQAVFVLIPQS
jgi:hypothetical protein